MKRRLFIRVTVTMLVLLAVLGSIVLAVSSENRAILRNVATFLANRDKDAAEGSPLIAARTLKDSGYRNDRSDRREDYPNLTDAEFANFRVVATTGMGKNVLYRSSSPINPELHRNRQADEAVKAAGIRTVLNLADKKEEMLAYEGYANTWYSTLDVIPLNMSPHFHSNHFRKGFAKGIRYINRHEGPYLLHCTMGRDRTGMTCAILECLMGATAQEVIDDYMLTFYNLYGIEPGTDTYDYFLSINLASDLADLLGIDSITSDRINLSFRAQEYLRGLGLADDEIAELKDRLGRDYP